MAQRSGREYLLVRARNAKDAWVKLLLSCPVKDWCQPLGRSETTDDIKLQHA